MPTILILLKISLVESFFEYKTTSKIWLYLLMAFQSKFNWDEIHNWDGIHTWDEIYTWDEIHTRHEIHTR